MRANLDLLLAGAVPRLVAALLVSGMIWAGFFGVTAP